MLEPLATYIISKMIESSDFSDAISGAVETALESRQSNELIGSIVQDHLENVSIEINTRSR